MRLIEGNKLKFIELETTGGQTIYINPLKIVSVQQETPQDFSLFIYEQENGIGIRGTVAEFFSTLGCNVISDNTPIPF